MPTFTGNRYPVASGYVNYTAAVKSDGTLVTWGESAVVPAPAISNIVSLCADKQYGFVVKTDGTVQIFGSSPFSWMGADTPPAGLSGVVMADCSDRHTIALKSDGTVVCWGSDGDGQTTVPAGLSGVVYVAASDGGSLAVKSDGTVVGWGTIGSAPAGVDNAVMVSALADFALALNADGTVSAWGTNVWGESTVPAGITSAVSVAAGGAHSLIALADGTVVAFGYAASGQIDVPPGLSDVVAVYAGNSTSMAIKADGSAVMWGDNAKGQSAVPASTEFLVPGDGPLARMIAALNFTFSGEGSHSPTISGDISAGFGFTFSGEGYHDPTISGDISAGFGFTFSGRGFEDWASNLASSQVQEFYTLTITGDPDLAFKISSWQATYRLGSLQGYLQAALPGALGLAEKISDRQTGDLIIHKGYKFANGDERKELLFRSSLNTVRYDRGHQNFTFTLSGNTAGESPQNGLRTLSGIRSINLTNGKFRVRCAIDLFLRPGMTAVIGNDSFAVDSINFYVSASDQFCEVIQ
jgi:hypothetical protein